MADVLVVESSELGGLLTTLFEEYGIAARWATSSEQALEIALAERPKVVIVEFELPDASGLDVAELLKPDLEAHVIVTYRQESATKPEGAATMARIAKLDGGFRKPFRSRALIELAADFLGRNLDRTGDLPSLVDGDPVDGSDPLLLEDVVELFEEGISEADYEDVNLDDLDSVDDDEPRRVSGAAFVYTLDDLQEDHLVEDLTPPAPDDRASRPPEPSAEPATSASDLSRMWADIKKRDDSPDPGSNTELPTAEGPPALDASALAASEGELSPRLLGDTLDAFHQSETSGEIWLRRGDARRAILLVRGTIVGARSNLAPELLQTIALRRGLIDEATLDAAEVRVRNKTTRNLVSALLDLGIDRTVLRRLLDEQARRIVLGAFTWADGSCRLSFTGHGKREGIPVRLSVGDVLVRSIVLTESIEALQSAAPDEARFAPNPEAAYALHQLTLSRDEATLVVAMDGTKTIQDLTSLFPEFDERLLRGISAGLFRVGLLRFAGWGSARARNISFF